MPLLRETLCHLREREIKPQYGVFTSSKKCQSWLAELNTSFTPSQFLCVPLALYRLFKGVRLVLRTILVDGSMNTINSMFLLSLRTCLKVWRQILTSMSDTTDLPYRKRVVDQLSGGRFH
ncbi:uncharacterized protein PHALS_14450 [Plasmopara halstedii]|uniref:Uncharacterized protein n=1 Tax=Plasmopara halstedii TaxID=4781 RepID=A0A0P1ARX1_PLAHL|nr:uncharacterized protein PHALS_14450 [Plasmopara halstedii]CEG44192.1 hypothetical protein PHALS_14450 [Plasmopara halstedii]|eukprot:XP_024580561.1 hypothetical protein PHALS_14450 [Plasmopara halstedii]